MSTVDFYLETVASARLSQLTAPFAGVGNALYVEIRNDGALLRTEFAEPPVECPIGLVTLSAALTAWKELLLSKSASTIQLSG
ncbi:MAG: hypothetical protein AB1725_12445 [Armatimonadota bacterium]